MKPLFQKLGLKPEHSSYFLNAPENYFEILSVPFEVKVASQNLDFVHFFTSKRVELNNELPRLRDLINQTGMIWVSWPKKASKVPSEIQEDDIRELALMIGMVDVKVCSVNEIWSGLKLMIRKSNRI